MKIDHGQTIKTLEGKTYEMEGGAPMTLRSAIIAACSMPLPGDDALNMVDKFKVGEIAMLAHKSLDLTAEQVTTVKERISKGFTSPTLVYLLHTALETAPKKAEK